MEHLVRFTTTEGRDAQHVAPSLDDALRFVERLRNNEEATVVRLFRLQEVPVAFKTYYRAEIQPVEAVEGPAEPVAAPAPQAAVKPADGRPAPAAPDVDSPEQQARKLFSRG